MPAGVIDAIRSLRTDNVVVRRTGVGTLTSGVWTGGSLPTFTVNTGTDVITRVDHGLVTGDRIQVRTTGTLPAPLVVATTYFVIRLDDDTFKLAETLGDAHGENPLDLTTAGTGTHSFVLVIVANVQPATGLQRVTGGQDMREDFSNQYTTDVRVLWTLAVMRPRDGGDVPASTDPDIIEFAGEDWTVIRVESWTMPGYVPYYKVLFTKDTGGAS